MRSKQRGANHKVALAPGPWAWFATVNTAERSVCAAQGVQGTSPATSGDSPLPGIPVLLGSVLELPLQILEILPDGHPAVPRRFFHRWKGSE